MSAKTSGRVLASCAMLVFGVGCGSGGALTLDVELPPRVEVYEDDGVELFSGRLLSPDPSNRRSRATLDLGEIRDGQVVSDVPSSSAGGEDATARFEPGVFKLGAIVSLDADADVQISTIKISYLFSTGTLELERTVGQLLRTGDVDVPVELAMVNGLGELQLFVQSYTFEASSLGDDVVVVPVEIEVVATDAIGSGEYVSNTVTYEIEMCNECDEVTTQNYAVGKGVNP